MRAEPYKTLPVPEIRSKLSRFVQEADELPDKFRTSSRTSCGRVRIGVSVGVRAGVGDEYGHKLKIGSRIILEWVGKEDEKRITNRQ